MTETYSAVLQGDHIEWKGESPRQTKNDQRVEVFVTIPEDLDTIPDGLTDELAAEAAWIVAHFRQLAEQWRKETRHFSSLSKMALHPAYQQIIGMGKPAVPLLLTELKQRPDHWLWALHAITGEDPASPEANFGEAVQAWIEWGKQKGYLN